MASSRAAAQSSGTQSVPYQWLGWRPATSLSTPWLIGTLLCVNVLARVQLEAPLLRVLELTMCRSYYALADPAKIDQATGYVEEGLCKIAEVQRHLATFRGWYVSIDNVMGLIAAVPYLYLGQTWDRRILILFECLAWFLGSMFTYAVCLFYNVFNINVMYFAVLASLFGGSPAIAVSFTKAILAETVPSASLSKVLFYLSAGLLCTGVIGFSLAATMMQYSLAMPVVAGFCLYGFTLPLIAMIPEPRARKKHGISRTDGFVPLSILAEDEDEFDQGHHQTHVQRNRPDEDLITLDQHEVSATDTIFPLIEANDDAEDTVRTSIDSDTEPLHPALTSPFKLLAPLAASAISSNDNDPLHVRVRHVLKSFLALTKEFATVCPRATSILAAFALAHASLGAFTYMGQWASKVHGYKLAEMNYVTSYTLVMAGLTVGLLPTVIRVLKSKSTKNRWCWFPVGMGMSTAEADLTVARWSMVVSAAGAGLIALSWSRTAFLAALGFFALRSGFRDALQAFGTGCIEKDVHRSTQNAGSTTDTDVGGDDFGTTGTTNATDATGSTTAPEASDASEHSQHSQQQQQTSKLSRERYITTFYVGISIVETATSCLAEPLWAKIVMGWGNDFSADHPPADGGVPGGTEGGVGGGGGSTNPGVAVWDFWQRSPYFLSSLMFFGVLCVLYRHRA